MSDSKARNVCHRIQTGAGAHHASSIMGAAVFPFGVTAHLTPFDDDVKIV
jgi:hypothetical protein